MSQFYQEKEPKKTEEKIQFLKSHQIYVDLLSNYVVTYLLTSEDGLLESFATRKEPLNLSLKNLEQITTLDTKEKRVYVFENPSMLMALLSLEVPIVITGGNPNYVVYCVLEKLIESGNTIYYNGDFDPEGILIAHSLKKRFPSLQLFCYDVVDFEQASSTNQVSKSRLKKIEAIEDIELLKVKEWVQKKSVAGYQEKNIKRIEEFIQSHKNRL